MTAGIAANRPDRGGDQRFGDTGATICRGGLLHRAKGDKGMHNPPGQYPNRPIYGLMEPTVPRNGIWVSSVSSSRFIEIRIARDAPSTIASGAWLLARCRRVANSSETAVEDLFRTGQVIATPWLSWYKRDSSIPDQNLSSNASASRAAELRIRVL